MHKPRNPNFTPFGPLGETASLKEKPLQMAAGDTMALISPEDLDKASVFFEPVVFLGVFLAIFS